MPDVGATVVAKMHFFMSQPRKSDRIVSNRDGSLCRNGNART
jgi:hypothetical protein